MFYSKNRNLYDEMTYIKRYAIDRYFRIDSKKNKKTYMQSR